MAEESSFEMDSHFELFRSLRMSNERWNDDIAYAFSTHRLCLRVFGVWPLQTQTLFAKTLWISWTIGLVRLCKRKDTISIRFYNSFLHTKFDRTFF